jgi:lambda family phage portal protein
MRLLPRALARRMVAWIDGIEAGRYSRRLSGWLPTRAHVNTLISASGKTVLARARYLVRNNGYAAGAVECFANNLVGDGIVPSWTLPKDQRETKKQIQEAWKRWTDEADADGVTDLYGIQRRVARELFIAGECFVRFRPRFARDGLSVPLQLQVIPSEQLPTEYTLDLDNGNRVRQGIEFDPIGRRVAYWFWRQNPGDSTERPASVNELTRVPASAVLHVYDPVEAGQVRGLPRLTPAIVALWVLDGYDDAELERKKTAALFSIFITRPPSGDGKNILASIEDTQKAELAGKVVDGAVNLQPASVHELLQGEDVKIAAPADVGPNYEAFQYRTLTKFCASVGLPYAGVTGDMVRANYGNQRAALIESRRRIQALQHSVAVFQFCRPVANAFLDGAQISGALALSGYATDPVPWRNINWIPPRWEWVDPLKDRQAEVLAVNAGFKARSQVIEAEGYDAAEVDERIAEDAARAKELGISFVGTLGLQKELSAAPTASDSATKPEPAPEELVAQLEALGFAVHIGPGLHQ